MSHVKAESERVGKKLRIAVLTWLACWLNRDNHSIFENTRALLAHMRHRLWASSVIVLTVCCMEAAPALACSGPSCAPDQFIPRAGDLPANAAAIAVQPSFDYADDDAGASPGWRMQCKGSTGATREVELEVQSHGPDLSWLVPSTALIAGEHCTIEGIDCDLSDPHQWLLLEPAKAELSYLSSKAQFQVTEAVALPTKLGELQLTAAALETLEVVSYGGGCSTLVEACSVHATLALDARAEPWKDALIYSTLVDGKPWHVGRSLPIAPEFGGSYIGRGREILVSFDASRYDSVWSDGLLPGKHTLQMHASLPGTEVELKTAEVELTLDCPTLADHSAHATDASVATSNGSARGTDAGVATETSTQRFSGGGLCAVSLRESGTPSGLLWLSALGWFVARLRRRKT